MAIVAAWVTASELNYVHRWEAIQALRPFSHAASRKALITVFRRHGMDGERALAEHALTALENNCDAEVEGEIRAFLRATDGEVWRQSLRRVGRAVLRDGDPVANKAEGLLLDRWNSLLAPEQAAERESVERDLVARWNARVKDVLESHVLLEEYAPFEVGDVPDGVEARPHFEHRSTGILFVHVPAIAFDMGTEPHGARRSDRELRHRVLLRPFLLARAPLTWAELRRVGESATIPGRETPDHPARDLSWEDAMRICEGRWTLPTEAQWEGACRAGTTGDYGGSGDIDAMGWHLESSSLVGTRPVGRKRPNHFGLFDMHGNVSEWCADTYNESFYGTPEASGVDPCCHTGWPLRVTRGGAFDHFPENCRSASRGSARPLDRECGLRPARPLL